MTTLSNILIYQSFTFVQFDSEKLDRPLAFWAKQLAAHAFIYLSGSCIKIEEANTCSYIRICMLFSLTK